MGRYEGGVEGDGKVNAESEMGCRDGGYGNGRRGGGEAGGVIGDTEDVDFSVCCTICWR
jgi:hypothetical protein